MSEPFNTAYDARPTDELCEREIEVSIVAKRCVYVNDYRIAGSEPYVSEGLPSHSIKTTLPERESGASGVSCRGAHLSRRGASGEGRMTQSIHPVPLHAEQRMGVLALKLAAGEPCPIGDYHSWSDWRSAAEYALDSGDWSEFASMLADEDAYEGYQQYSDHFYTPEGSFPPLEFEEWRSRQYTPMQRES